MNVFFNYLIELLLLILILILVLLLFLTTTIHHPVALFSNLTHSCFTISVITLRLFKDFLSLWHPKLGDHHVVGLNPTYRQHNHLSIKSPAHHPQLLFTSLRSSPQLLWYLYNRRLKSFQSYFTTLAPQTGRSSHRWPNPTFINIIYLSTKSGFHHPQSHSLHLNPSLQLLCYVRIHQVSHYSLLV